MMVRIETLKIDKRRLQGLYNGCYACKTEGVPLVPVTYEAKLNDGTISIWTDSYCYECIGGAIINHHKYDTVAINIETII